MFSSSSLPACRRVAFAAVAAVAVSLIASPASAAPPTVRADGQALAGTVRGDGAFLASVEAPAGSKVKFKVDGTYLGQDTTAPYAWPVAVGAGTHKLEVRWESPAGRQESTVSFSVGTPRPAAPAPAATPKPVLVPANVVQVSTAAGLKTALANARPGQVIELRDGRYIGAFKASASGTAAAPITLRGSRNAVLSSGSTSSGYGLHVTGSHWRITGVSVASSAKGIVLDGSTNTIIDGVDVGTIGAEAVTSGPGAPTAPSATPSSTTPASSSPSTAKASTWAARRATGPGVWSTAPTASRCGTTASRTRPRRAST